CRSAERGGATDAAVEAHPAAEKRPETPISPERRRRIHGGQGDALDCPLARITRHLLGVATDLAAVPLLDLGEAPLQLLLLDLAHPATTNLDGLGHVRGGPVASHEPRFRREDERDDRAEKRDGKEYFQEGEAAASHDSEKPVVLAVGLLCVVGG